MEWITAAGLAQSTACLLLGDMVYLPHGGLSFEQYETFGEALRDQEWVSRVIPGSVHRFLRTAPAMWISDQLMQVYTRYRYADQKEPAWTKKLEPPLVRRFRVMYQLTEGTDPWVMVPELPFSGMGYIAKEGGLTERTVRAFGLARLAGVKQLGFLHDPMVRSSDPSRVGFVFQHNRYEHSMNVMAVATLIAANNQLPPRARFTLRIAALSHDALTPAGGDTTKLIDRKAFDEDGNFPELLARRNWSGLRRYYGLRAEELISTIQGRGALGRILDIADKAAYVSRDLATYMSRYAPHGPSGGSVNYHRICHLVHSNPHLCGIWDAVRVMTGDSVVVEDADRLASFLTVRAYLVRELYYNPGARFLEHMIAKVVIKHLYDTGVLTRERLLTMVDLQLEHIVGEVLGRGYHTDCTGLGDTPRVETFRTSGEAYAREVQLQAEGVVLTLVDVFKGATNGGLHLTVKEGNNILPFREARPDAARRIEEILHEERPVRLYYMPSDNPPFSPEFLEALAAYRVRELQET